MSVSEVSELPGTVDLPEARYPDREESWSRFNPVGHTVDTGHTDGTYGAAGRQDDVLLVGAGVMAGVCAQAASRLADQGIGVTVVDSLWVKPVEEALVVATRGDGGTILAEAGLTPQHLARQVTEIVAHAAKRSAPIEQHSQAG